MSPHRQTSGQIYKNLINYIFHLHSLETLITLLHCNIRQQQGNNYFTRFSSSLIAQSSGCNDNKPANHQLSQYQEGSALLGFLFTLIVSILNWNQMFHSMDTAVGSKLFSISAVLGLLRWRRRPWTGSSARGESGLSVPTASFKKMIFCNNLHM